MREVRRACLSERADFLDLGPSPPAFPEAAGQVLEHPRHGVAVRDTEARRFAASPPRRRSATSAAYLSAGAHLGNLRPAVAPGAAKRNVRLGSCASEPAPLPDRHHRGLDRGNYRSPSPVNTRVSESALRASGGGPRLAAHVNRHTNCSPRTQGLPRLLTCRVASSTPRTAHRSAWRERWCSRP